MLVSVLLNGDRFQDAVKSIFEPIFWATEDLYFEPW